MAGALLVFVSALLSAQTFPVRQLPLPKSSKPVRLGPATFRVSAQHIGVQGLDRDGRPWTAQLPVSRPFQMTARSADFDNNGQQDLLFAQHRMGSGWCPSPVELWLLLFDESGRPVPYLVETHSYEILETDRNGRAEFEFRSCAGNPLHTQGTERVDRYEAAAGRLISLSPASAEWPDLDSLTTMSLDALWTEEVGCHAMRPSPAWPSPNATRLEVAPNPCEDTPPAEMQFGSLRTQPWAGTIVRNGPQGRHIDTSWASLQTVLRYGYPVKLMDLGPHPILWANTSEPRSPAQLVVQLVITKAEESAFQAVPEDDGCWRISYSGSQSNDSAQWRRWPATGHWTRDEGRAHEERLPDRRGILRQYTAMHHTRGGNTRFETPPGATSLLAVADIGHSDHILTQWGQPKGRRFALHSQSGALIANDVHIPLNLDLIGSSDSLLFADLRTRRAQHLTEVRGRIRWSRR